MTEIEYWTCCDTHYTTQNVCYVCGKARGMSTESPKTGQKTRLADNLAIDNPLPQKLGKKGKSFQWAYKGMVFDSETELDRYLYLEKLEDKGLITDLARATEIELRQQLIVPSNAIHGKFTQSREVYTPDFAYRWRGYFILEDVKGKRFTPKPKHSLKPKVESATVNKYKDLQAMLVKHPKRVFLLTVYHAGYWHYFNSNQNEIQFSLELCKEGAA